MFFLSGQSQGKYFFKANKTKKKKIKRKEKEIKTLWAIIAYGR